ncbi:hypothetical protein ABEG18_13115 [Alsobacter sp. KACC 23698]|uniref:Uncharacterized protein n=1 Tax=Alsobacter sp. KACC 23698 TaxID=3149229 RepID=A0AAU7J8L3_9HYPH
MTFEDRINRLEAEVLAQAEVIQLLLTWFADAGDDNAGEIAAQIKSVEDSWVESHGPDEMIVTTLRQIRQRFQISRSIDGAMDVVETKLTGLPEGVPWDKWFNPKRPS